MSDLMKELTSVRKEVSREYQWFQSLSIEKETSLTLPSQSQSSSSLHMIRKRLLYLFVKDLTVGVSKDVLSDKATRDSLLASMKINQVSPFLKLLSWLFVIILNGVMLIYVYLFAINQTSARQSAWFQSFVLWLFFEILISSTGLVLIIQLLIPLYVFTDVMKVKQKVLSDLLIFRDKYSCHSSDNNMTLPSSPSPSSLSTPTPTPTSSLPHTQAKKTQGIKGSKGTLTELDSSFNAAKYLYPSWRIASLCQQIPESKFILQFSTLWPKKKFGEEEIEMSSYYEEDVLTSAFSRILLFFITSLLHFNDLFQDIIVQILSNSGLGYFCYSLIQLSQIHPLLPLGVIVTIFLCLHFFVKSQTRGDVLRKKMNLIHPDQKPNSSSSSSFSSSSGGLRTTTPVTLPPAPVCTSLAVPTSIPLPPLSLYEEDSERDDEDDDEVSESEVEMVEEEEKDSSSDNPLSLTLPLHLHINHFQQQPLHHSPSNSSLGSSSDNEEDEFVDFVSHLRDIYADQKEREEENEKEEEDSNQSHSPNASVRSEVSEEIVWESSLNSDDEA
jgi:hypothetical protein